jgi:sulfite reductase (ferredoxin)
MSVEEIKRNSQGLRGSLPIELVDPAPHFSDEGKQLLKFHGIYQQHDRDVPGRNKPYKFMLRSKMPGGKLTAEQYLVHDALADEFGQGDLRLTTRQAIQLHGVIKGDLKATVKRLNEALVSTLGACGDVERNLMCCPAPFGDPVREQIQSYAEQIAVHLCPRSSAYHQIWLEDEAGQQVQQKFEQATEVIEPIYGKTYLPRKFKTAIAFPGDNCTDIFTNDIGLVALIDESNQRVHGFNVFVGGGMGQTHNKEETFARLASPLGYTPAERMVEVVEKIVLVQRDFGDRQNRRHARLKYLVHDWGIDRFRDKVEEYLGYRLEPLQPMPPMQVDDHLGWQQRVDGLWFYGLFVQNGRIKDEGAQRLRSGLRHIITQFRPMLHLTGQQSIILSGFTTEQKPQLEHLLWRYGLTRVEEISHIRRHSLACPALPTCSLALTEAERYLPTLLAEVEPDIAALGLAGEAISIRMTGCPNGCARPFVAEIGLVGRSGSAYNVYLGGALEGTRLNLLYQELVERNDLRGLIYRVLAAFKQHHAPGERFGDWSSRLGLEQVRVLAHAFAPPQLVLTQTHHGVNGKQTPSLDENELASAASVPAGRV